jgi:hypothetical protein
MMSNGFGSGKGFNGGTITPPNSPNSNHDPNIGTNHGEQSWEGKFHPPLL